MALTERQSSSILRTARRRLVVAGLDGLHELIVESVDEYLLQGRFPDYAQSERRLIEYLYALYYTLRSMDSGTAARAMESLSRYTNTSLSLQNAVLHWGDANENTANLNQVLVDYAAALGDLRALIVELGLPDPDDDGGDNDAGGGDGGGGDEPKGPPAEPSPGLKLFLTALKENEQTRKVRTTQESEEETVAEQVAETVITLS